MSESDRNQTLRPIVTGQSVVAVIYKDGVMMAADTMLSYGSQRKFKNIERIIPLKQSKTLLGFSGEYSDVQHILKLVEAMETDDFVSSSLTFPRCAEEFHGYLSRLLYQRRCKMDPLWTTILIAGFKADQKIPYLGYVDYQGTSFTDTTIATGFGSYLAVPLLRAKASVDMSEGDAKALLEETLKVLFARDCYGNNQITVGKVTDQTASVGKPYVIHPEWHLKAFLQTSVQSRSECSTAW